MEVEGLRREAVRLRKGEREARLQLGAGTEQLLAEAEELRNQVGTVSHSVYKYGADIKSFLE